METSFVTRNSSTSGSKTVVEASKPDSGQLFQEELVSDPFWMMVACILINRTHWRQVRPVLQRLMMRYDGAKGLSKARVEDLLDVIKPLGLYNRRSASIKRFALAWMDNAPKTAKDVAKLPGCGPYAVHSWMIFVDRVMPPVDQVSDGKLAWYLENRS